MPRSGAAAELITSILGITWTIGLTVVAEGVETAEVKGLLIEAGCRNGQGCLFSRPIALEQGADLLRP